MVSFGMAGLRNGTEISHSRQMVLSKPRQWAEQRTDKKLKATSPEGLPVEEANTI